MRVLPNARWVCLVLLLAAASVRAQATPPELLSMQGRLTNASGVPENGSRDIVVRFYDAAAAGNLLLTDSHTAAGGNAVTVTNGIYDLTVGGGTITAGTETTLGAVFRDQATVWVSLQVGADPEMTPRTRIVGSGYAVNSRYLDGFAATDYVRVTAGSAGRILYDNGTTWTALAAGTSGQPLLSAGAAAPSWGTLSATYGGTGQNSSAWSGVPTVAAGTWSINSSLPVGAGGTGTTTAFTQGSVVFAGASGVYSQDNANFFWDDTNNRLGVGRNSPTETIDVIGRINANSDGATEDPVGFGAIAATSGPVGGSWGTSGTISSLCWSNGYYCFHGWSGPGTSAGGLLINLDGTGDAIQVTDGGTTSFAVRDGGDVNIGIGALLTAGATRMTNAGVMQNTTWNGTAIAAQYGGTGLNTSASTGVPTIAAGTWSVANPLGVSLGGTGSTTTFTAGSVVFAGAGGAYAQNNANFFWDNTSLRLGIGTTTPQSPLHVYGSADPLLLVESPAGGQSVLQFRTAGTAKWAWYVPGGGNNLSLWHYPAPGQNYIQFDGANGNIYLAQTSGNVGVGTTAPLATLSVVGQGTFGSTAFAPPGSEPVNTRGPGSGVSLDDRDGVSNRWVVYPSAGSLRLWQAVDRMTLTPGGHMLLNTGQGPFGVAADIAFSRDDIVGWTTLFAPGIDDGYLPVALPFPFEAYGVSYPTIWICTNAWISFGDPGYAEYINDPLPSGFFAETSVCAYWDDMATTGNGVRYTTEGIAPNRTFIVDFELVRLGTTFAVTFQIQIHEGSNLINIRYYTADPNTNGQSATIGMQGPGGVSAKALPLIYDGRVLDDNFLPMSISFSPIR